MKPTLLLRAVGFFLCAAISCSGAFSQTEFWQLGSAVGPSPDPQVVMDSSRTIWCLWKEEVQNQPGFSFGFLRARYFQNGNWSPAFRPVQDTITGFALVRTPQGSAVLGTQFNPAPLFFDGPTRFQLYRLEVSQTTRIDSFSIVGNFGVAPRIQYYNGSKMFFFLGGDAFGYDQFSWRYAAYSDLHQDSISVQHRPLGGIIFCSYGANMQSTAIANNGHCIFSGQYVSTCHGNEVFKSDYHITDLESPPPFQGNIIGSSPTGFVFTAETSLIRAYNFFDSSHSYSKIHQWNIDFAPQLISSSSENIAFVTTDGQFPHRQLKIRSAVDSTWYVSTSVNLDTFEQSAPQLFESILSEDSSAIWLSSVDSTGGLFVYRILQSHTYDSLLTGLHVPPKGSSPPSMFMLSQNYPNPFNPETNFQFSIAGVQRVSLKVFDVLGRVAATIVDESLPPGTYNRSWDASKLPSGVYFYRLQAGTFADTKKLLLLK